MANPNPDTSNLRPYMPGQSGNPGGKTSEQRRIEVENAEKAMRIRAALLDRLIALIDAVPEGGTIAGIEELTLSSELLRLIKDSEDRGLGAPVQRFGRDILDLTDEELEAKLNALHQEWAAKTRAAPSLSNATGHPEDGDPECA